MKFKDRLRGLREERKLSAAQLAGAFDKSEGAVRMWETGRSYPDADTLIRLAEYFNCSTDYLLGLSDAKNSEHAEQLNIENEKIWQLLQKYRDYKFRGLFPAYPFVLEVLDTSWFSFALMSICDYVMFEEANSEQFETMIISGIPDDTYGLRQIRDIRPEESLSHFLFSAQNQIGNVCKYLRDRRKKTEAGYNNAAPPEDDITED